MKTSRKKRLQKELKMVKCHYCLSTENLTIDHKIPLSQGGTHDIKNLQCLCKRCNGIKSGLSHREVRGLFTWFRSIEKRRTELEAKPIFKGKKYGTT